MQYRKDKYGNPISVLGYGCMRFSQTITGPDFKKAEAEVMSAINQGINYFDTAYIYPGSEATLGKILEKNNVRDKVKIATKLPHYLLKKEGDCEKLFNEELTRLRTDHVDYYLMHMLSDAVTWNRLVELGVKDWLEQKKKEGVIRQIGFSYHGNSESFMKLIDAYDWDFCMIQYNYMDETSQAGVTGVKYAASKGIPIMIMEPLRGGKLATKLPKDAVKIFKKYKADREPAEWSFRWLWNQPEITCVLSGMNSLEMVAENIRSASKAEAGCLSDAEKTVISDVVKEIRSKEKIGCTGCRYCMPCPKSVDIPGIFAAYNRRYSDSKFEGLKDYVMCTLIRKNSTGASNCIKCGKCEQHCPQGIHIREELETVRKTFEGPIYKIAKWVIPLFMKN